MTTEPAQMEALFPNLRDAADFLKSPLFHHFIELVAAFRTESKDDDKAAFAALLIDAGMPEMAGMVEPLYDLVILLMSTFAKSTDPVVMMAGGGLIHRLVIKKMQRDAAHDAAKETGKSFHECYSVANDVVTPAAMAAAMVACGVPPETFSMAPKGEGVGALFDGHIAKRIKDWIATHPEQWAAIKKIVLALILAALGL